MYWKLQVTANYNAFNFTCSQMRRINLQKNRWRASMSRNVWIFCHCMLAFYPKVKRVPSCFYCCFSVCYWSHRWENNVPDCDTHKLEDEEEEEGVDLEIGAGDSSATIIIHDIYDLHLSILFSKVGFLWEPKKWKLMYFPPTSPRKHSLHVTDWNSSQCCYVCSLI